MIHLSGHLIGVLMIVEDLSNMKKTELEDGLRTILQPQQLMARLILDQQLGKNMSSKIVKIGNFC